jgi:phosphatidate cytidylyltransferase
MALNKKSFQTRAITAIVFAAVMLAGLFLGPIPFLVLFSIVHIGCWWEYLALIEKIHKTSFHIYIKLGLIAIGYGLMISFWPFDINSFSIDKNLSLPVSAAGFAVLVLGIFQKAAVNPKAIFSALAGLVYISIAWGLMLDLYDVSSVAHVGSSGFPVQLIALIPPVVVFTIWINDTMAYIVGSFIGKTPLSSISPKKTWEGTIGGIILAVAVSTVLILFVFNFSLAGHWYDWLIISAITAIAGTFGDLLESKLKRMAGVKDSGSFMPGHGGFLDRFDSLLLAIPFVWLYIQLAWS